MLKAYCFDIVANEDRTKIMISTSKISVARRWSVRPQSQSSLWDRSGPAHLDEFVNFFTAIPSFNTEIAYLGADAWPQRNPEGKETKTCSNMSNRNDYVADIFSNEDHRVETVSSWEGTEKQLSKVNDNVELHSSSRLAIPLFYSEFTDEENRVL